MTKYRITYVKEVIEVEAPTVESAISTAAEHAGRGREDINSVEMMMSRPAYVQVDWKQTGKVTVEEAFGPIDWPRKQVC